MKKILEDKSNEDLSETPSRKIWAKDPRKGGRYLIAKHEALRVLQRLHSIQRDIATRAFEQVLGMTDLLLFRNALGLRPRSFNGIRAKLIRAKLIRESGLGKNVAGQGRTLCSLRRTFATQELLAETGKHMLAKQMGTSMRMLEAFYSKLAATMSADDRLA